MNWQPTISREMLHLRARLLGAAREFFEMHDVIEVDTPIVVNAPVTDVHLESASVSLGGRERYLHTSPEYAMKRLLAAGMGDLYQICHVIRDEEPSRLHNPEFTMIEWYRRVSMRALVEEVAALLNHLLVAAKQAPRTLRICTYQEVFSAHLGIDPLSIADRPLQQLAIAHGLDAQTASDSTRDDLLDFLIATRIGPALGNASAEDSHWLALTHYPASQAALARLDAEDSRMALRFEFYADGVELANGFEELADAPEQAARFAADNAERARRGLAQRSVDTRLLGALHAGLPACSGVALGFDRVLMLVAGAANIREVIPFPTDLA